MIELETTSVDQYGAYSFSDLNPGTYYISLKSCTKKWGGSNSIDAYMIMQYFLGNTYGGLPEVASDVWDLGSINTTDAFAVQQRFVHLIDYFESGDWVTDVFGGSNQVVITNSNVTHDVYTICFGDVNRSFIPY